MKTKLTKDLLLKLADGSKTKKQIQEELGCCAATLRKHLKKYNIKFDRRIVDIGYNKRYGKLITIKPEIIKHRRGNFWLCLCECGNNTIVSSSKLKNGGVKSCGCLLLTKIIGKKFGKLKVLTYDTSNGYALCGCLCDCSRTKDVRASNLQSGRITNCGCERKIPSNSFKYIGGKYITGKEFASFRGSAKRRNIAFNISIQDIEEIYERQSKMCKLTGRPIKFNSRKINGIKFLGDASLDRIDSNLPYEKNNIQIIHKDINFMKSDFDLKYFLQTCEEIVKHNK